jgi:hypothetical protein
VGGNCGVFEGTVVKRGDMLAAGVILTRSTPVYDLVRETIHRAEEGMPLVIRRRGGGGRRQPGRHTGEGDGVGAVAVYAGDREIPGCFHG